VIINEIKKHCEIKLENNYYVLGIDEAGYGPDIGPLVVTSSLFKLSKEYDSQKFWKAFFNIVSKKITAFPEKVVVSDSKYLFKNYPKNYLIGETTVLCFYSLLYTRPLNFQEFLQNILMDDLIGMQKRCKTFSKWTYKMCWGNNNSNNNNQDYNFFTKYPLNSKNLDPQPFIRNLFPKLQKVIKNSGIDLIDIKSIVLCPRLYNESIIKGGKLYLNYLQFDRLIKFALKRILIENNLARNKEVTKNPKRENSKSELKSNSLNIFADKLGSTKYYLNYLNSGFFKNFKIKILKQSKIISSYEPLNLNNELYNLKLKISFAKEGDKIHFPIALSSIFGKYIRERLIKNINKFFISKIINLKPTKGYAYKLKEFIEATDKVRKKYNIETECFLRKRENLLNLFN